MAENFKFVVAFSPDARKLLEDNGVDLVTALREAGLSARRAAQPVVADEDHSGKEVLLTLLGVGLTASMLAAAISKILDAVGRNKKVVVTQRELCPVLDGANNVVRDAAGQPVMYWAEEQRLLESQQIAQDKSKISAEIGGAAMLKFSITNS